MTKATHQTAHDRIRIIAGVSIAVAFIVMAIKYAAYLVTGSVALYSDALESIVNVIAGAAAFMAVSLSAKPPDKEHPFGHHKAELFSAVFEGALIIVAALLIVREAVEAIWMPRAIDAPALGLLINGAATVLNAGWSLYLINRGKALNSAALQAGGWHILTDVWTSLGVLAGILLVTLTGWSILDPLLALAVAANILFAGYVIVSGSLSRLLDEAAPEDMQARIRTAIAAQGDGALQAHDIRTRHAGPVVFIEFHLVVPGEMTVAAAHEICDRLEEAIEAEIEGADVIIHVEPDHKAKRPDSGVVEI